MILVASTSNCDKAFAINNTTAITLRLVGQTQVSAAGAIVASKVGLFAREGLIVTIENVEEDKFNLDDRSLTLITLQGARQFLLSRGSGNPIAAFAGNYIDSAVTLYFRRERQIRSPQDLAGKSIGYDSNSDSGLIFEWFLNKNAIPRSSITEISHDININGIVGNTLDVFLGVAGVDNFALERAGVVFGMLDPRQYGVHALGSVYVTTEHSIRETPDVLVRFLRALIAGWDLTYEKMDQAIAIIAPTEADYGSIKQALNQQRELLRPGGSRFGDIPQNRWVDLHSFMLQQRVLKSPIDLSKATDSKLITEAYRSYEKTRPTLSAKDLP